MCSKSRPPASRAVRLVITFTAAAAAAAALMAAAAHVSPSSLPILGVEAFSPSSRLPRNKRRLLLSFDSLPTPSGQRIYAVLLHAAATAEAKGDEDDDEDESESNSSADGDEPAPSATAEDEVSRQVAKAKELIERTKQKMEKKEKAATAEAKDGEEGEATETTTASTGADDDDDVVPFFAVDPTASEKRRELITKTKDEESGLITTDGEKMASLAEEEKWESRGLFDLFENENEDEETLKKEARASRDVARSMMGLKMIMNKDDFDSIFDKRNFFIGEE
mmetsp:Transcript_16126/g.46282  ORF Transcript_16126/g.46282 Transcript_16126/m.46282 type:complete len:280 (-) Transcript_16126:193-1032(-)